MTGRTDVARGRLRGSYFFLSYAHSLPLAGSVQADQDRWVGRFFSDLTGAVQKLAPKTAELAPGFYDQDIPLSSDWKKSLAHALSTAEVFVPLYSPGYFARSWPGREWACFYKRLTQGGVQYPHRRFTPVLWIPLAAEQDPPGLREALAIGESEQAYAENGLRALLRLNPYRSSYQRVVDRIATEIVRLVETEPLSPSPAPDIDEVASPFASAMADVFTITVAAPVRHNIPDGRSLAGYGQRTVDWRPYHRDQQMPLADYAVQVAEQLDFAVAIAGIDDISAERTAAASLKDGPGLVLVDPWLIADEAGESALASLARDLPSWVLPLLVCDSDVDERGSQLTLRVRTILRTAGPTRVDMTRRAIEGVNSLSEFIALLPILVTEAERQYLQHGPITRFPARSGSRPLLALDVPQTWQASPPRSSEEASNA